MSELTSNSLSFLPLNALFTALTASSSDGIIVVDTARIIRVYNPAAEKMFGYAAHEADNHDITLLFPPDRRADEENLVKNVLSGQSVRNLDTFWRHKDGSEIPIFLSAAPLPNARENITGALITIHDAAPERAQAIKDAALEAELAHVSRLSAMGEMSAAIAHELNQPLTAVTNYVKAAQRFLSAEAPSSGQLHNARDAMQKAADQTIRAGTIIRYLRDFVEKRETEKIAENINQVIREAVTLSLVGTAHHNIKVKLDLGARIPRVMIDKIQIQQVLLNLLRNAVEAMSELGKGEIHVSSAIAEERYAEIVIRDTGPGFLPEIAGKLFHAFATTKRDGLGIGLKICQSIIEAHGGSIKALNNGPGAAFQIRLPLP
jgi:two-component system, LuxR family, sensor kinase FixL